MTQRMWYTPKEVAFLLRVNPKTVSRWCRQGRLKSIRTKGGHHRISVEDVDRILGQ